MRWRAFRQLILPCLILCMPGGIQAQGLGTITGIVKDTSGAVIPGANVTAVNQDTGLRVTVRSLNDGGYRTPQ